MLTRCLTFCIFTVTTLNFGQNIFPREGLEIQKSPNTHCGRLPEASGFELLSSFSPSLLAKAAPISSNLEDHGTFQITRRVSAAHTKVSAPSVRD